MESPYFIWLISFLSSSRLGYRIELHRLPEPPLLALSQRVCVLRPWSVCSRNSQIIWTSCIAVSKGKGFPLQAWSGPWGSRRLRLLDLLDFRHYEGGKVVTLTHRPSSTPEVFLVLIFRGWVDPRAHGSVGSFGKNPQRHHWGSIPRPSD
jgi:hypothetical protein